MPKKYRLVTTHDFPMERTFSSVRSLKSAAKRYLETCAVPADLVLIRRSNGTFGFMHFNSHRFSLVLGDLVTDYWWSHELKYE